MKRKSKNAFVQKDRHAFNRCAPHSFSSQVLALEGKLKDREAQTELLHQELNVAKEAIKGTDAEVREHIETAGIFKDKYMAAVKKLHEVHGQAEQLQEELKYSQQQVVSHNASGWQLKSRSLLCGQF